MRLFMTQHLSPYILKVDNYTSLPDQLLSGLKLAVKDLFHIKGLPTSAGNPDWLRTHPVSQATSPVVSKLLANGATLVGKTITDELAFSLNGQNIHYGTPVNILANNRLPGGSSSGSAVAVSDKSADIGLGTDTGGSIRVPASYNGLVGLRTTHGLVSTEHMVGLAPSFDTVGWMTRDLHTLSKITDVLLTKTDKPRQTSLSDFQFGIALELVSTCEHSALLTALYKNAINEQHVLHSLGTEILTFASATFKVLQGWEIWQTHGPWILKHQPYFAPDIHARFLWCKSLTKQDQQSAVQQRLIFEKHIAGLFDQCDVIFLPTSPGPAPLLTTLPVELEIYRHNLMNMTCIAGLCGLPQLHIPAGLHHGAPVGFSLIGQKNSEKTLIALAKLLTEKTK
ncbi:MAG: amidase [Paraglaciecola sp.]|jgi:amidase